MNDDCHDNQTYRDGFYSHLMTTELEEESMCGEYKSQSYDSKNTILGDQTDGNSDSLKGWKWNNPKSPIPTSPSSYYMSTSNGNATFDNDDPPSITNYIPNAYYHQDELAQELLVIEEEESEWQTEINNTIHHEEEILFLL